MEPLLINEFSNLGSPFGGQGADVAIIGGGLAGLSLSILLAKAGYIVVLLEKEKYPFHKVCGEYISLESHGFINSLGLDLEKMNLPIIKKLIVSSPNGKRLEKHLPLGGFGISRYTLDNELSRIATNAGVKLYEETKVNDIVFKDDLFTISAPGLNIQSKVAAGTFGKRSNIDVKWSRDFTRKKKNKLNNYIGIKYHVQTDLPVDTIALHNFKDGYCGISKIEDNKYCLCYLTTAENLKLNNNSISELEMKVLQKNPFLKQIFSSSKFLPGFPVTISQISFDKKSQVENNVMLIGDAAGMITPLCGNGMSMALHAGKIAFDCINSFLQKKISRQQMEDQYVKEWGQQFAKRLRTGRMIQHLFGKEFLTNLFISAVKPFPFITRGLIRSTHGKPF
ncbi:MAG TPA: NAD(P)/FAD-dependent oxidoreductase [Chitinophagaceae bacterium]|nr:NAD(P)/FAD-dependent oxidoreductase [Chitinophagaceae bacterium]